jgi:hypothetical protein
MSFMMAEIALIIDVASGLGTETKEIRAEFLELWLN